MLCLAHSELYFVIARVVIGCRLLACDEKIVEGVADLIQLALILVRIARHVTSCALLLNDRLVYFI